MKRLLAVGIQALIGLLVAFAFVPFVSAQSATSTGSLQDQINAQNAQVAALTAQIAQYEAEIQQAGADKASLQNAINTLDLQRSKVETQITATQHQINATQLQIQQIGTGISNTQTQISANEAALAENIRSIQETDDEPFIMQLFSTNSLADAWDDVDATLEVQGAIGNQTDSLHTEVSVLSASKVASQQKQQTLTAQKQSLASQQAALIQTKAMQSQLLAETNAKESTYEKLLAQAQQELTSFSAFATNAGGAGILTNQTSCDSWGCYYNQRDSQWGNDELNGTKYLLKSDGCLITSLAMVMTHYGYKDVTPVTINSNPSNFAAYFPAYLLYTINVDGVTVTRKTAAIDATLATGNPVIVGLYAYGGTHFVVLVSGSHGNYLMRDPYQPNAKDIPFTQYYAVKNIFGVNKVVISA